MNSTDTEHQEYRVSIDLEAAGSLPLKNGFLCLGSTLVRFPQYEEIATFKKWASMEGYQWDEACVERFWKKNPALYAEALEETKRSKLSPFQVVQLYFEWLEEHTGTLTNVQLISDNPAYDVAYLRVFGGDHDIFYAFKNKAGERVYTDIIDTTSFFVGVSHRYVTREVSCDLSSIELAERQLWIKVPAPEVPEKAHCALDDARGMMRKYCAINRELQGVEETVATVEKKMKEATEKMDRIRRAEVSTSYIT